MPHIRRTSGFTMIEIMVVVVVIGILAALALPSYRIQMLKIKNQEAIRILMVLWEAQKDYYRENGVYTNNVNNLAINIPTPKNFGNPILFNNFSMVCGGSNQRMLATMATTPVQSHGIYITEKGEFFCFSLNSSICTKMGLTPC